MFALFGLEVRITVFGPMAGCFIIVLCILLDTVPVITNRGYLESKLQAKKWKKVDRIIKVICSPIPRFICICQAHFTLYNVECHDAASYIKKSRELNCSH